MFVCSDIPIPSYINFYLITRGGILGGGAIQLKCLKMCVLIHAFLDGESRNFQEIDVESIFYSFLIFDFKFSKAL